ncbi:SemiSWEET family transporter [Bradyrhizobium sp.]|uniref:SemiSWEET family transporter n=1 Tax=Bradyrhizobium sp. TaxID=376 RepID=UPI0014303BC9|nr:SemiSWEET family transporter [Bradyrhizobium sp.]
MIAPKIIKQAVNRTRPDRVVVGDDRNGVKESGKPHDSFPSGHSVNIGAVVSALSWAYPEKAWLLRAVGVALERGVRHVLTLESRTGYWLRLIRSEPTHALLKKEPGKHELLQQMPKELTPYLGALAAFLALLSYLPQVKKAWPRGSTGDLLLGMLLSLTMGLGLWVAYGVLQSDWVIVAANAVGATLSGIVLGRNARDIC